MIRVLGNGNRLCDGLTRRESLLAGGLSLLGGLSLPRLLAANEDSGRAKAKHVIVVYLENRSFDGQLLVKNNCNFFRLRGDLFCEVFVYMSGDNSLR